MTAPINPDDLAAAAWDTLAENRHLRTRIETVTAERDRYGRHLRACASMQPTTRRGGVPCSCGWAALTESRSDSI